MGSKAKEKASRISRSENMRRIRSKDTGPELAVRKLLRDLGFTGYRLSLLQNSRDAGCCTVPRA